REAHEVDLVRAGVGEQLVDLLRQEAGPYLGRVERRNVAEPCGVSGGGEVGVDAVERPEVRGRGVEAVCEQDRILRGRERRLGKQRRDGVATTVVTARDLVAIVGRLRGTSDQIAQSKSNELHASERQQVTDQRQRRVLASCPTATRTAWQLR